MLRPSRISGALLLCLGMWTGILPAPGPVLAASPVARAAPAMNPENQYTLRIPDPASHLVEVEARLPAPEDGSELELMMATWTPGSYLIREYARHVEGVEAKGPDGTPLAVRKTAKNRWTVAARSGPDRGEPIEGPITFRYTLYAHELTVRTNFVTDDFGLLNGAATFVVPADENGPLPGSFEIRLEAPDAWGTLVTALAPGTEDPGTAFTAPDYDTLVDSPIYVGTGRVYDFLVDGVPHRVLHHGGEGVWDDERSVEDVRKIVEAQRDFWGSLPYEHYDVINLLVEAGGGLEHASSTVLMTSRWSTSTPEGYRGWLGLVSHELFHAWNVKRLYPSELSSFDYEREIYSRNLWIAEGVTSYYDDLLLHRAGLLTRDEYLSGLSQNIGRLQRIHGRLVQSVELASFDAWIKAYRPDENIFNSSVSYYTKGAVVAFLLDAEIRRASGGERTLGDALRTAWERFADTGGAPRPGFDRDDLMALLEETAGTDLAALLDPALTGVDELDYEPALEWLGLRFAGRDDEDEAAEADEAEDGDEAAEDAEEEDAPAAWLGAITSVDDGRLKVTRVPRETPAAAAGLSPDDEILAIDGYRVPPRDLDDRLGKYSAGQESTLLISRRERLLELPVTFGEKPDESWKLEVDPDATEEQEAHREAWLGTPGD